MKKYQIIYADPPWEYDSSRSIAQKSCLSRECKDHYSYMSIQQICALPIKGLTDTSALLFLWTTSPKLNLAFNVISAWGFTYSTVAFVWEKVRVNPSYYTLSSTELCLVARKGNIPKPRGKRNIRQFYQEERNKHSKKPDGIRNLIVEMFPMQAKIELFARQKTEGWDVFGNDVEGSIDLGQYKNETKT
jgi:N6-adenosine-specific RNA methylase IME4